MYWILGIQSWMNECSHSWIQSSLIQSSSTHSTFPGHTIHVCYLKFCKALCNFALENIYFDFLGIRETLILFLWFWKVWRTGRTRWWMWEIVLKSSPFPAYTPFARWLCSSSHLINVRLSHLIGFRQWNVHRPKTSWAWPWVPLFVLSVRLSLASAIPG